MNPTELARAIAKGPQGPKVIAVFDLEGALVDAPADGTLLHEKARPKGLSFREAAQSADAMFKTMGKRVDRQEIVAQSVEKLAGRTELEIEELGSQLYEQKIQDAIYPEMQAIIAAHREAGHTLAIASTASRHEVAPTAKALGIEHLLCTELEVADGRFTGKLIGEPMLGSAKGAAVKRFVAKRRGKLANTHVYAGGEEDAELLAAVGQPHPVNPAPELETAAHENGWQTLRLRSRSSAKPMNIVRGVAGLLSVVPILQTGLAFGMVGRSKRETANAVMPTWLQAQLMMAGVKLRVWGEPNLHAQRPAVFIFNHRNNFDASFVAALVQTDYVTVAKKEMAKNPIGKLVAAISPTIFVDRESGEGTKTSDTLKEIMAAIAGGNSVILAPEGTRVRGHPNSVGRFKLGAFHVAMTAEVPIVPVVIRNALDVASHSGPMRAGTVDIAVLEPVAIAHCERRQLGAKVKEIRQSFIDTLENWPPIEQASTG